MQRKVLEGNCKCYSSEHMNDKEVKQPYCCYGESFSGLDRRSKKPKHSLEPKPNPGQSPVFNSMKSERGQKAPGGKCGARRGWVMKFKERSHLHDI